MTMDTDKKHANGRALKDGQDATGDRQQQTTDSTLCTNACIWERMKLHKTPKALKLHLLCSTASNIAMNAQQGRFINESVLARQRLSECVLSRQCLSEGMLIRR